jgi:hypothetical protein
LERRRSGKGKGDHADQLIRIDHLIKGRNKAKQKLNELQGRGRKVKIQMDENGKRRTF